MIHIIAHLLRTAFQHPVQAMSLAAALAMVTLAEYPGLLRGAQHLIDRLIAS